MNSKSRQSHLNDKKSMGKSANNTVITTVGFLVVAVITYAIYSGLI